MKKKPKKALSLQKETLQALLELRSVQTAAWIPTGGEASCPFVGTGGCCQPT